MDLEVADASKLAKARALDRGHRVRRRAQDDGAPLLKGYFGAVAARARETARTQLRHDVAIGRVDSQLEPEALLRLRIGSELPIVVLPRLSVARDLHQEMERSVAPRGLHPFLGALHCVLLCFWVWRERTEQAGWLDRLWVALCAVSCVVCRVLCWVLDVVSGQKKNHCDEGKGKRQESPQFADKHGV